MISHHKITINLLLIELVLLPILTSIAGLYSSQFITKVSLLYRFGYIALFLNAILYIYKKKKIKLNFISYAFLITLFTGIIKGLFEGTLDNFSRSGSPIVFSNIFSILMPVVMLSYGGSFMESYLSNNDLRNSYDRNMKYSFYVGAFVVLFFTVTYSLGLYVSPSINIWNFIYSGPYLYSNTSSGNIYFVFSAILTLIAAKRSRILGMAGILILFIALASKKQKKILFFFTGSSVAVLIYFLNTFFAKSFYKIQDTFITLGQGDFDAATSGRLQEALAAINYLSERVDHLIFGAGFGANYWPYIDILRPYKGDIFYNLRFHYSHFTPVSYVWLGGIFLSLSIYIFLISLFFSLSMKVYKSKIPTQFIFIPAYILSIILMSFIGSTLFNNTFLWLIIGAGVKLNKVNFSLIK